VEALEETVSRLHDRVVPVLERVDHSLEVEGETAEAVEVDVVRLEEDDGETDDRREEGQLDVADPKTRRLDRRRCDEHDLLNLRDDGRLLDDELEVSRCDGARETRDEDGGNTSDVVHRGFFRRRVVSVTVRVVRPGIDRTELHRRNSQSKSEKRQPLCEGESSTEHDYGCYSGDEGLELEGDLEDGDGEVASGDVAVSKEKVNRAADRNGTGSYAHKVILQREENRRNSHFPPIASENVLPQHPNDSHPSPPQPQHWIVQHLHHSRIRTQSPLLRQLLKLLL
jgi:hypothetical protein